MRFTLPRLWQTSVSAIFLLLISVTAFAQPKDAVSKKISVSPLNPRITINLDSKPLRDVIVEVFRAAKVNYLIHPDVPLEPVTISLRGKPLSIVLQSLFKRSSRPLDYRIVNDIYHVETQPDVNANPVQTSAPAEKRVIMGLTEVPLRTALILILEQHSRRGHISAQLSAIARRTLVTVRMDQPLEAAVKTLRQASGVPFQFSSEEGILTFLAAGETLASRPVIRGDESLHGEKRVTIDVDGNVPITQTLRQLMRQFKAEYDLHPDLDGATVAIRMENVTLDRALAEMGKASSLPFTYKVEKGVYHLVPVKSAGGAEKKP